VASGPSRTARATYLAYRAGASVALALPEFVARPAARGVGRALSLSLRGRRAMVERHLRRVHGPALQGLALQRAIAKSFDSYTRYWLESFRLPSRTHADVDAHFSIDGLHLIDEALAGGKGAIVALPHLGGWEVGGYWLAGLGYRFTVVVEPLEPAELFEWFADYRRSLGMNIVALGPDAGPTILRALKDNQLAGLLCDRDLRGDGCEVEFFGERTTLPGGPATLALRTGAPIMPAAVYFRPDNGHHAVVKPPLTVERTGRLRDDVGRVTQDLAYALEDLIRAAPEQWHLMQPNWPSDRAQR
jgi:KDO2-lipid IV(A) lauroyltransferase